LWAGNGWGIGNGKRRDLRGLKKSEGKKKRAGLKNTRDKELQEKTL